MLQKLLQGIEKEGVELKLNTRIDELEIIGDNCTLKSNGQKYNADQVICSSLSSINKINYQKKELILNHRITNFTHFHLIIKGKIKKPISYIRVMDHLFIHRVSDIRYYAENGSQVFAIGVFKEKVPNKSAAEIVELIKSYFIQQNWISESSVVEQYFENTFETKTIDHFQVKELQEISGITVLRSTNLIFGIGNNIERWSKVTF